MADCFKNACVITKDTSKPALRSPFRTLASLDSDRVFKATGKIFLALIASLVLIWNFALNGQFSEASTFSLQAGTAPAGLTQVINCMFTGSLTAGGFACTNTQQGTGSSFPTNYFPDKIVILPMPALIPPDQGINSYWNLWLGAGCFPTFASSSDRCRAISYLLGYQIFTTILLSGAIVVLLIGLMFTAEALLQMAKVEDEKDIVALRVTELWKWMAAAVALTGFSFFTWPIVLLSALTTLRDFYATALLAQGSDQEFGSYQSIAARSALVRPGAAYFYVIAVFCLTVYSLVHAALLERAYGPRFVPPPQTQFNQGQQQPYQQQPSFTGAAPGPSDGSIPGWPPKPPPQETMQQQYAASSYEQQQAYQQQQAMYQQQQAGAFPPPPPGPPPPLPPGFVPPPPPPEVN